MRRQPWSSRCKMAAWQASAVGKANHHVDRIVADFHQLHDRTIGGFHQRARFRRLVDAGDDQAGRLLRQEHAQQLLFLQDRVARIGKLDAVAAAVHGIIDAAQHIGEHIVGEGGDQNADHLGALRGQRACREIGHIAELLGGALDPDTLVDGEGFRRAEETRSGDRAHAGKLCHFRETYLARLGAFPCHGPRSYHRRLRRQRTIDSATKPRLSNRLPKPCKLRTI